MDGEWGFRERSFPTTTASIRKRSVVWRKDRFFIIWDRLKARYDGTIPWSACGTLRET